MTHDAHMTDFIRNSNEIAISQHLAHTADTPCQARHMPPLVLHYASELYCLGMVFLEGASNLMTQSAVWMVPPLPDVSSSLMNTLRNNWGIERTVYR